MNALSSTHITAKDCPRGTCWALILAAGSGSRLAASTGGLAKQFLSYKNLPLYWHSAMTMSRAACIAGIVFVFPSADIEAQEKKLRELHLLRSLGIPFLCVAGGERRQDSVRHGLLALPPECAHVLVHDAARPFASASLVHRVCKALHEGAHGVIPGIAVTDTIKEVHNSLVVRTHERNLLRAIQTPQGFDRRVLCQAHAKALELGWDVTDDAALLELCDAIVHIVEGESANIKITHPQDLAMLQEQNTILPCTGFGYDVHRFGKGRPLKLGGILMDGGMEVLAHSDGDVLLHALMDALLGCAALGDIGQHFPDTAQAFDNADSAVLLDEVLRMTAEHQLRVHHVDLTIITQKPKVGPQRKAIQKNVAQLLSLHLSQVNVKATTEEGLGFTGACEGIKAVAVVTATRTAPTLSA